MTSRGDGHGLAPVFPMACAKPIHTANELTTILVGNQNGEVPQTASDRLSESMSFSAGGY